ncbi:MAG: hypothetical protein WCC60_19230 [Ilumatobacteraceae bacterium]
MAAIVREYQPMGVRVTLRTDSPEMADAIEAGLARYPPMGVRGSLDLDVVVHDDCPGDPGWPRVLPADGSTELVVRIGSSIATLLYATGAVRIDLARSLCAVPDALRLLAESVFTAYGVRGGALHALHSALVVHDGVGLVLRGASGAGKSTLTYSCLRTGMGVCSDDWLYADASATAGTFAGYPWRMLMTEDAAARFPELAGAVTIAHPAAEGRKIPVHPPTAQQVVTAEARAVVMLDPSPHLALRELNLGEALERFWAPALPTEQAHLAGEWVAQLLARPVYVLQRGTDPIAAVQLLAELATSLR